MKRKLLTTLFALTIFSAFSVEPSRGYRGFVEVGTDINSFMIAEGDHYVDGDHFEYIGVRRRHFANLSIATSHGFQFNPNFFLGGGILGGYSSLLDAAYVDMYAHARTDQTFGRFTPYADLRVGIQYRADGPLYISPTVGYRFNFGHKANLNIGLGLTLTHAHHHDYDSFYYNRHGELRLITFGSSNFFKPAFTFRAGIDF